jgi:hypothetical protein
MCANVLKEDARSHAPASRLHRITRLMALAIRFEALIQQRVLIDYSDIASLGKITKPRVTQIMNLLNLAPDIQEHLLFLPPTSESRDRISERQLRHICKVIDWDNQRCLFSAFLVRQLGEEFPTRSRVLPRNLPNCIESKADFGCIVHTYE